MRLQPVRCLLTGLSLSGMVLFWGCIAMAAAPVVDLSQQSSHTAVSQSAPLAPASSAPPAPVQSPPPQADFYYQLQILQEEVRSLRGLVEEQAHEIRQLKQRQMDDYMDLDRRISGMSAGISRPASASGEASAKVTGGKGTVPPQAAATDDELRQYNAAYGLLKARKVDESIAAFKSLLIQYPGGQYAANSYYWLGEIYLLKNQLEDARQSFSVVVEQYPAHRKVDDARFKLGKTYHLMGEKGRARALLEQVAGGSSGSARLAQAYLRENFE